MVSANLFVFFHFFAQYIHLYRYSGCHTASRRITNWAMPHPKWATPHPLGYTASSELRCALWLRRTRWATPHPTEQRHALWATHTLLGCASPYCATPHPTVLRRILWATPHSSELRRFLLGYRAIEPTFQQADALPTGGAPHPQCYVKGTLSRDFLLLVYFMNQFPQAPDYTIRAVSKSVENSRRYSQLKVCHRRCSRISI